MNKKSRMMKIKRLMNLLLIGSIVASVFLVGCDKDDDDNSSGGGTNPPINGETGTFSDSRDSKTYKWVEIGNQVWMAENLNYESGNSWAYDNNPAYSDIYGRLYDWNTALTSCPDGWHLPTDPEWTQLENYLKENGYSYDGVIGNDGIAKSLATNSGWDISGHTGVVGNSDFSAYRNITGFSALPSGHRSSTAVFFGLGSNGNWWSATEGGNYGAHGLGLYSGSTEVYRYDDHKSGGFSVRCVRD